MAVELENFATQGLIVKRLDPVYWLVALGTKRFIVHADPKPYQRQKKKSRANAFVFCQALSPHAQHVFRRLQSGAANVWPVACSNP